MAKSSVNETVKSSDETKKHGHLTLYIVIAIVAAVTLALAAPRAAVALDVGGEVFLRLLQMVVVPLVMASVMSGILGLGDVRKLGRPGGYAVLYYLTTTVLAVTTGLVVVNIIDPGVGISKELIEDARQEGAETVEEVTRSLRSDRKRITWTKMFGPDRLILDSKSASGSSNPIAVAPERNMVLVIRIQQVGEAAAPAEVQVLWSGKGQEFQPLQWTDDAGLPRERFVAGHEPDTYAGFVPIPASVAR
jgi:hypothetical protein